MTDVISDKKEIHIVNAGSIDAGKSTLLGVLTDKDCRLDDGNGLARSWIAKHPHEHQTGRTSDISDRTVIINGQPVTLVDLCGHESYLKTTLYGITSTYPDYAILVVAANRGVLRMTREHLGIYLFMKIPFIIVITRVDIAPPNIYDNTIKSLSKLIKRFQRRLVYLNSMEELKLTQEELKVKEESVTQESLQYINMIQNTPNIIPVITVSSKTGYFIPTLKNIIGNLKPREVWHNKNEDDQIFYVERKFNPKGIGMVLSGIARGKSIKLNDTLLLGPFNGNFIPIKVWSIHDNNRNSLQELKDRQTGCIAIRILDKKIDTSSIRIRKGHIVINKSVENSTCYQFSCSIQILNHSTTISNKYTPQIHCGNVRQTARIIIEENQKLKIGDRADNVGFRFVGHPEFLEKGTTFFFREGTTRGVGTVTDILLLKDDPNKEPAQPKIKKRHFHKRRYRNKNKDVSSQPVPKT